MINLRLILIMITALSIVSCNKNKKFDKVAWKEKGDLDSYPNRDNMLNDLIKNYPLKGLSYKQLINLLGEPEKYSDAKPNVLYYNVVIDYGHDIDPVYIKDLKIKLNSDSVATDININEIKH